MGGMFQFVTGLLGFNSLPKANVNSQKNKKNLNTINVTRKNTSNSSNNRNKAGINVVVRKNAPRSNNVKINVSQTPKMQNEPINIRINVPKNNHTKINMRDVNQSNMYKKTNRKNNFTQFY
jgi:hypothetical protein